MTLGVILILILSFLFGVYVRRNSVNLPHRHHTTTQKNTKVSNKASKNKTLNKKALASPVTPPYASPAAGKKNTADNNNPTAPDLQKQILSILIKTSGTYAVGVKDLSNGRTFFINSCNKQMQSASLIKIFIMMHVFKAEKDQNIIATENTKQLINLMITKSDNSATNKLIDLYNMKYINKTISSLGFKNTFLKRKMLDDTSRQKGIDNLTTVNDLMNALDMIYNQKCLGKEYDNQMLNILKNQQLNSKIPSSLPKGTIVAHKTGELPFDTMFQNSGVQNDAGIIYAPHKRYILCIMSERIKDANSSISAISNISKVVWDYFNQIK